MLKNPRTESESVRFRELFINDTYVSDNGGTIVGAPTIDNGIVGGTGKYVKYDGKFLSNQSSVSFEVWFTPGFAPNDGANQMFFDTDAAGGRYILYKSSANTLSITLGNTLVSNIAYASYSAYWNALALNHLVVCATSGSTNVYLNGNLIATSATAWTPTATSLFYIASNQVPDAYFSGTIHKVSVYKRKLSVYEVTDKYNKVTFQEIRPNQAAIWLNLKSYYNDGSNYVTRNLGTIDSSSVLWGDGSTAATFPELLPDGGVDLTGVGNPMRIATPATVSMVETESYTFSAIVKPEYVSGNDYLFAFGSTTNTGIHAYYKADAETLTFFADSGGAGLVAVTGMGNSAGMYHIACVANFVSAGVYDYLVYKDGVLVGSDLAGANFTGSESSIITIGSDTIYSQGFSGKIYQPILFRKYLTPTQINWLKDYSYRNLNI